MLCVQHSVLAWAPHQRRHGKILEMTPRYPVPRTRRKPKVALVVCHYDYESASLPSNCSNVLENKWHLNAMFQAAAGDFVTPCITF